MKWQEPRRVDVWWWMQIRIHDDIGNVVREGTVTWNADGTGHYGVFISFDGRAPALWANRTFQVQQVITPAMCAEVRHVIEGHRKAA